MRTLLFLGTTLYFHSDARKGRISTVNIAISSNRQEDDAKGVINLSGL
jgi:hypothetical protein